ncbi:MAG: pyridoxal phosphate-dependent aminotransferase [Proteobacteria bacterium]|nr:pyridoxal phosphate-dependent aminotransferase [Pseudomonadota bacterium]
MPSKDKKITRRAEEVTPFYVMDLLDRAKEMESKGENVIHFEVGEPDFETPPCIRDAAKKAIDEKKLGYSPSLGLPELREALAERYLRVYGVNISPERVVITSGSSPALQMIFGMLLEEGDEVIMTDPHYACYANFVRFFGGKPVFIETRESSNFRFDPDMISAAITARTKAILVNSPANPTGVLMPEEDMKAIAAMGINVVSDEIYHGLCYEGEEHSMLEYDRDAFIIDGFSKRYAMTGWRLGYAIVPDGYVRPMQRLVQNFFISAPVISQWAGLAALEKAGDDLAMMRSSYDKRRRFLISGLEKIGLEISSIPAGAFYIFVNMRRYTSDSLPFVYDLLDKAKVAVTPGIDFGSAGEGHIRLSYAISEELMAEGLRRIARYLDAFSVSLDE